MKIQKSRNTPLSRLVVRLWRFKAFPWLNTTGFHTVNYMYFIICAIVWRKYAKMCAANDSHSLVPLFPSHYVAFIAVKNGRSRGKEIIHCWNQRRILRRLGRRRIRCRYHGHRLEGMMSLWCGYWSFSVSDWFFLLRIGGNVVRFIVGEWDEGFTRGP